MFKKIKRFLRIAWFYMNHKRCETCHKWSPYLVNVDGSFWLNNIQGFHCEKCFNDKYKNK